MHANYFSHDLGGTREGYEYYSNGADQLLITFTDGDHMIFSGRGRLPVNEKDARFQRLICASSTAFWDAYLRGGAKARAWLLEEFKGLLGADGTFELMLCKTNGDARNP